MRRVEWEISILSSPIINGEAMVMHVSTLNISNMVTNMSSINIDNKQDVAYGLSVGPFGWQIYFFFSPIQMVEVKLYIFRLCLFLK